MNLYIAMSFFHQELWRRLLRTHRGTHTQSKKQFSYILSDSVISHCSKSTRANTTCVIKFDFLRLAGVYF